MQNEIRAWGRSVGIVGPSSTVVSVRVDAEPALTSLLDGVLPCKLEKSAPQSPESTGHAERAVRVLKESLACPETDMCDSGFRLKVNSETLPYLVRYVCRNYAQPAPQSVRGFTHPCSTHNRTGPTTPQVNHVWSRVFCRSAELSRSRSSIHSGRVSRI